MSRLRTRHTFTLSQNSTETTKHFEKEQRDEELVDAFALANSRSLTLGPNIAHGVNFGGLANVQFIYVESDKAVTITINGQGPIPVTPRNSSAALPLLGRFYLWTEGVTTLVVTNPSSVDTAKVTVALAGA